MASSACQALCIFLLLSTAVCIRAQTTTQKVARSSISGKVTIKGKPAVGVMVLANDSNDHRFPPLKRYSARTDQTGSYRITKLPAGTYQISPVAPALVLTNQSDAIVVSEGEEVEDVNLSLVPGGVITGKITDSEGEPLIGGYVNVTPVYEQVPGWSLSRLHITDNNTDDRGVYRIFGLPPGKYRVSVGEKDFGRKGSGEYYKEMFYPSVTDVAKATIIEVTEGSETDHIDIALARPVGTFSVAGRVVDGETGRPIPHVRYGVGQKIVHDQYSTSGSSSVGNDFTNANGEFRLDRVTPGTYTIFTVPEEGSVVSAASVTFEVVDRNLTDLLIKTSKGSSLSGVVVLDGNQRALNLLSSLRLCATESKDSEFANPAASAVSQDGTFRIDGVRSGVARVWLCSTSDKSGEFQIVRVERNGMLQSEFNVKEGEQVAGIRVTVKHLKLTGAIRGQVKVENGELPPLSQLSLSLWPLDENLEPKRSSSIPSPQLDARGRFLAEGLPAGTYRVTVYVFGPGRTRGKEKTQQVIVNDDTVTEVTLVITPPPDPK